MNLGKLTDDEFQPLFDLLARDQAEQFVAVLWALVEPQAKALGVTPEQFAAGFDGDALDAAADAFWGAFAAFCPARARTAMLALAARAKEWAAEAAAAAEASLTPDPTPRDATPAAAG